ncbi:hypothetical protein [Maribacter sp. 2307ULW6-5]|uniref:hypothetical protein n=1 Tax=Maribacter sp. 2307ULW6-5 TaxID=3386275 RepID=UPI0039BD0C20
MIGRCCWVIGLLLFFSACGLDYEDNKRLVFKGSVLDENALPLNNVPVAAYVSFSRGIGSGTGREILGEGRTGADGTFSLVTLDPRGERAVMVEVNDRRLPGHSQQRAIFSLLGVETIEDANAVIDLGTLPLERIVNGTLVLRRSSGSSQALYYGIRLRPTEKVRYVDKSLEPERDIFFQLRDTLFPGQNELIRELGPLLAKDSLDLDYRLGNGPDAEVVTTRLAYDPENNAYVFEF